MNGIKLESVQFVKDLGITIASSQILPAMQGAAGEANRVLCFTNRNFSFQNKDIILALYISLVRTHLEYAVQF